MSDILQRAYEAMLSLKRSGVMPAAFIMTHNDLRDLRRDVVKSAQHPPSLQRMSDRYHLFNLPIYHSQFIVGLAAIDENVLRGLRRATVVSNTVFISIADKIAPVEETPILY